MGLCCAVCGRHAPDRQSCLTSRQGYKYLIKYACPNAILTDPWPANRWSLGYAITAFARQVCSLTFMWWYRNTGWSVGLFGKIWFCCNRTNGYFPKFAKKTACVCLHFYVCKTLSSVVVFSDSNCEWNSAFWAEKRSVFLTDFKGIPVALNRTEQNRTKKKNNNTKQPHTQFDWSLLHSESFVRFHLYLSFRLSNNHKVPP